MDSSSKIFVFTKQKVHLRWVLQNSILSVIIKQMDSLFSDNQNKFKKKNYIQSIFIFFRENNKNKLVLESGKATPKCISFKSAKS